MDPCGSPGPFISRSWWTHCSSNDCVQTLEAHDEFTFHVSASCWQMCCQSSLQAAASLCCLVLLHGSITVSVMSIWRETLCVCISTSVHTHLISAMLTHTYQLSFLLTLFAAHCHRLCIFSSVACTALRSLHPATQWTTLTSQQPWELLHQMR